MNLLGTLYNLLLISLAGLFIAFSPLLIITNMLIVLNSKRPVLYSIVLLSSVATPLVLLAIAASFFIDSQSNVTLSAISEKLSVPPLLVLLLGTVLLGNAATRWQKLRNAPNAKRLPKKSLKPPPTKLGPLFAFGFMKSLLSATNIFAILFVTKLITTQNLGPLMALFVLFLTLSVGMIPFFVVLYYQKNRRQYLLRLQARVEQVLQRNLQLYIALGIGFVGGLMIVDSTVRLLIQA